MARLFNDASTEYLEVTSTPVTATPLTLACWFYSDTTAIIQTLIAVHNHGLPIQSFTLDIRGDIGGDPIHAATTQSSADSHAATSSGYSANTWHHAAAVFTSPTSRAAFIDGGSKGTNTTSRTPSSIDHINIGALDYSIGQAGAMSGRIAEAAIWNVALTDAEVASLAAGFTPPFIRPQSLVAYWPLVRDEDQDNVGGYDLTPINTPSIAAHPPIIYPAQIFDGFTTAGGAVAYPIPEALHSYRQRRV